MKRLLPVIFMLTFSIASISQTNLQNSKEMQIATPNMYTIRHNAIYTEDLFMYNYERLLPVHERLAVALKGGFMIWDPLMPMAEVAIVSGGPKSFIEFGTGAIIDVLYGGGFFTMRVGYRYQAPRGFLFKLSAIYSPDNFILPLIALGYAF